MQYKTLLYENKKGVAKIILNRPDVLNAQSAFLLKELDDAMTAAERDEAVRIVILAAKGTSFSSGHDLKEFAGAINRTVEDVWKFEEAFYLNYCLKIWDLKKPTIAQVQGNCVAGGFMLANMCDIIVASKDAVFGDLISHRLGVTSAEIFFLPWVIGHRKAREILYTGQTMNAQEALASGMINRVVPRKDLEAETMKMAEKIAQAPPFGLRLLKRSLNRTLDIMGFRNAVMAHFDTNQLTHYTEEFTTAQRQYDLKYKKPDIREKEEPFDYKRPLKNEKAP